MSQGSSIEWTDATWNPVVGCTRVSAGCDHCYAVGMTRRLEGMSKGHVNSKARTHQYVGLTVKNRRGDWHFNGTVRCVDDALEIPLHWKQPRRIFVNSMSDLFHRHVPFEFIDKVFAVMALCPQHTFQVLTKRPERMAEYLDSFNDSTGCGNEARHDHFDSLLWKLGAESQAEIGYEWPLPNVWLGTSCENQEAADERIPHLLRCHAPVRFLSCEPLLGPIDLTRIWAYTRRDHPDPKVWHDSLRGELWSDKGRSPTEHQGPLHWVIAGGESGPGARPCDIAWIRSILQQCKAAGVPAFVKQLGQWPAIDPIDMQSHISHACCMDNEGRNVALSGDQQDGWMALIEGVSSSWHTCRPEYVATLRQHRRLKDPKGGDMNEWPEDLRVREFPATFHVEH